ncbi:Gcv operon activator [Delftia tsuruhatensis]|uniref:LysR substrate-binding domain-containing protein n=1 Tax=Delftia tsuruhatensis TaxID=180282 RepID=UPI001E6AA3E1|nr:LysR substrate-binding domain-containing protein [Delftia tsuruhatensis]CAB5723324.1 Gcv operon activator [Delftia tsuruhatensis]CAC9691686.1 Gcv operon activator [Delftia tsuruhatensis]
MAAPIPLLALRAFVEVGQRGSLRAAADGMHVTPGAVSQQIRLLEERVGVALFTRERQGLRLTEAGARVHPGLLQAFAQIESCMQALERIRARPTLTVSTMASFAAAWLVPRLGRFNALHPGIEVRVEASAAVVDLQRSHVDVALRHGLGEYPGLEVRPLMAPVLVPVARPGLVSGPRRIRKPADCLGYPLLHDSERADWPLWLAAHGVAVDDRAGAGMAYGDDFLLIRAAEAGQGLALVPREYAAEEIAAGRLVQVLDRPWPARFAYYAVTRPESMQRPEVRAFVDWVTQEAQASCAP